MTKADYKTVSCLSGLDRLLRALHKRLLSSRMNPAVFVTHGIQFRVGGRLCCCHWGRARNYFDAGFDDSREALADRCRPSKALQAKRKRIPKGSHPSQGKGAVGQETVRPPANCVVLTPHPGLATLARPSPSRGEGERRGFATLAWLMRVGGPNAPGVPGAAPRSHPLPLRERVETNVVSPG